MSSINYNTQILAITAVTGWTRAALAYRLGLSPTALSAWLTGRTTPRDSALARLEDLYIRLLAPENLTPDQTASLLRARFSAKNILSDQAIFAKFIITHTAHSLSLAGHPLTIKQVRTLLQTDRPLRDVALSEQLLAKNHAAALIFALSELSVHTRSFAPTPAFLAGLHLRLFNGIYSEAGYIRPGYTSRQDFTHLRDRLITPSGSTSSDPLAAIAREHAALVHTRPFPQGSDLVARITLVTSTLQLGLFPPIITNLRLQDYERALTLATRQSDLRPFTTLLIAGISFTNSLLAA